jgi:hypothetical protein
MKSDMKKVCSWLICVAMLLTIGTVAVFASANTSMGTSQELTDLSEPVLGTISQRNERDWFKFTTGEERAYYYFNLQNESGTNDAYLSVYDVKNTEVLKLSKALAGGDSISGGVRLEPSSTYYIKAYMDSDGTGNYTFKISKKVDEIPDAQEQSTEIKVNKMYYQSIEGIGDKDCYVVNAGDKEAYYHLYMKNESGTGSASIHVINHRDMEMLNLRHFTGAGQEAEGNFRIQPGSQYYLTAKMADNGVGNYCFKIVEMIDKDSDEKESATKISLNKTVASSIDGNGDVDFFKLETGDESREYKVNLNNINGSSNAHVIVYTERDEKLLDVGNYTSAGKSASGTLKLQANTTYYFQVFMNDTGFGDYTFQVTQCVDGHKPSEGWKTSTAPTCVSKGVSQQVCSICGAVLETKEIDETGHLFEDWKVIKKPTMISLGKKSSTCTRCDEVDYKNDWSMIWIIPAAVLVAVAVVIAVIRYIVAYRNSRRRYW